MAGWRNTGKRGSKLRLALIPSPFSRKVEGQS